MSLKNLPLVAILPLALAACSSDAPPELPCEHGNGVEVFCGFSQPEDIEPLPDGSHLIISEMGGEFMTREAPGRLSFHEIATGERYTAEIRAEPATGWGQPECGPPEGGEISPHGIDLHQTPDGYLQLAVVSHYPRESIELFSVETWLGKQSLVWKGCIIPPEGGYINDLTATPDGRIFMTHMFDRPTPSWLLLPKLLLGLDTGFVWSWSPEDGFVKLPGSDGSFPNGITSDSAGETVFVNYYTDSVTRALDTNSGEVLGSFDVKHPDNVTWLDGDIYIASHDSGLGESSICDGRTTTCPLPYSVYRVDARSMQGAKLLSGTGEPFGLATVAVPHRGWLWMGSFLGDRIARVSLGEPDDSQP